MKISILSDLHLEFNYPSINEYVNLMESADILILAGDCFTINNPYPMVYFLEQIKNKFNLILFVPGNHEYYNCPQFSQADKEMKKLINSIDNAIFLQEAQLTVDDYNFIGATLWTDFDNYDPFVMYDAQNCMADYMVIKENGLPIEPTVIANIHNRHKEFIKSSIKPDKTNILITHHSPTIEAEEGSPHKDSNLSPMFHNRNLDISGYDLCIYGHTHENRDFISKQGARVVSNQVGYPHEYNYGFENKIIEI